MSLDRPRLVACRLEECEALCCYDGVYLSAEEARLLRAVVRQNPAFFSSLPRVYLLTRRGDGVQVTRTATRPHTYRRTLPDHFAPTRCVFADDAGRCALQRLALAQGVHPWTHKPAACWLHPLHHNATDVLPPPISPEAEAAETGAPPFAALTPCGMHHEDGRPWPDTLHEEIAYFRQQRPSERPSDGHGRRSDDPGDGRLAEGPSNL